MMAILRVRASSTSAIPPTSRTRGIQIIAVARRRRMKQFRTFPTFAELGVKGLEDEVMWRGFAVKKGTPKRPSSWWRRSEEGRGRSRMARLPQKRTASTWSITAAKEIYGADQ
jgi:tripartite-type tricarboxylate transporter receptor subunit TctC